MESDGLAGFRQVNFQRAGEAKSICCSLLTSIVRQLADFSGVRENMLGKTVLSVDGDSRILI
jgi:hypothetical protein